MIRYSATGALRDAYALLYAADRQAPIGGHVGFEVEADPHDDESVQVVARGRLRAVRATVLDEEAEVLLELVNEVGVASSRARLSNASAEALAGLIRGYLA